MFTATAINGATKKMYRSMKTDTYEFDQWLKSHNKSKNMMEKLERRLVPFPIFNAIGFENNGQPASGEVTVDGNTYRYRITYDYLSNGHDVYDAVLVPAHLENPWHNLLLGYNKFKLVYLHDKVKTIYTIDQGFFASIIDMLERSDAGGLYAHRSAYTNHVMSHYILLRLIEKHLPEMQTLVSHRAQDGGLVTLTAATPDRSRWILYAFGKREAMDLASYYDGECKDLTVVYFYNQNFQIDGNTQGYDSGSTRVMSARSFLHALTSDTEEQILTERRMLMLAAILHNENIEWHFNRVQNVVTHIPYEGTTMAVQKQKLKDKKASAKRKLKKAAAVKHWWEHIPLTLLEDALNVITETPRTHAEVFHFLCAANLVNAYVNRCNNSNSFSDKQINRMFQAKRQIFKQMVILAQSGRSDVTVTMSRLPALLVRIRVERQSFQFSFRGMDDKTLKELFALAIDRRGEFDGYLLQPVATALYQYSYLLRWQSVGEDAVLPPTSQN